jgi:isocitrate lyase
MASAGIETVYVSGWQSSSTASTSNEPGPDLADYPMDTVPNKVEHLFNAQLFHDRKQRQARLSMTPEERANTPKIDYLRPIVADGDTGVSSSDGIMTKGLKDLIRCPFSPYYHSMVVLLL